MGLSPQERDVARRLRRLGSGVRRAAVLVGVAAAGLAVVLVVLATGWLGLPDPVRLGLLGVIGLVYVYGLLRWVVGLTDLIAELDEELEAAEERRARADPDESNRRAA